MPPAPEGVRRAAEATPLQPQPLVGPSSLVEIALEALARSIQQQPSLLHPITSAALPEELTTLLFTVRLVLLPLSPPPARCCPPTSRRGRSPMQRVIQLGKLCPRVLDLFERTEHEALLAQVQAMGIRKWTPPLVPTSRGGPLGYSRPPWQ